MNFINYTNSMKALGTPFAIAGIAILGVFLVIIILKMLGGMRRGTWRQLVRTGATLLAAVMSFFAADWLSNHIIGGFKVDNIEGLLTFIESYAPGSADAIKGALASIDTSLVEYIVLLPATILIIPIFTTVAFLLINLVFKIIRAIVIKIIRMKKAKNNTQRFGGALLSAVEGIIWITMVMLPVCGALSLVDQAYDKAIQAADEESRPALVETYDEYLSPFTNNPALSFIGSVGADAMADSLATVRIDNERTNMRQEVLSVAHIVIVDAGTLKGADFTALNAEQKAALSSIISTLSDSPFMSRILIGTLKMIPSIYESGLIPLDLGNSFQVVIDNFMVFFKTINREKFDDDLDTIKQFYFGFCDSGLMAAIKNGNDLMKFISEDYKGEKHILNMINTLSGNPRTKGIVDGLYNLVLNAAFSGGSSGDTAEGGGGNSVLENINISDVKQGLNNIVKVNKSDYATEEAYREVLADTIDTTINDTIGVDLEDEVVDEISDYVDENYSEQLEELTDEEFNELMFEVIDIYQGYLNGEDVNPGDIEDILGGNGNGEGGDLGDLEDIIGGGEGGDLGGNTEQ